MTLGKAKVENAVGIVERWVLAALRHRKFLRVVELNEAIEELLERLIFGLPQTRRHASFFV
jgi:transposase